jgi:phage terminase large subunit
MKDTNVHYYKIYCLNEWGTTGESYFDSNILNDRLLYLKDHPLETITGYFHYDYENERIIDSSIKFMPDINGAITIIEKPKANYPYVCGGDTAGDTYGDFFSCHVIDNTTGSVVALLHQNTDESEFARQCYCLGKYFNYALIGLETNYSTYPVKELQRLGYLNQYQRRIEDKNFVDLRDSYGFLTNKLTRPIILANLQDLVKETKAGFIYDRKTIDEMLTFIRNEKKNGRPEADIGTHDDRVLSLAICMYIREQQRMKPKKVRERQKRSKHKNLLGY